MLILAKYVATHELILLRRFLGIDEIKKGAKKVTSGLAIPIKSPQNIEGLEFYKVRIGRNNGAKISITFLKI